MAEPIKLVFRPGINRETTDYTNSGGYTDGNLVRFRKGFPESIGGWAKYTDAAMQGRARSIHPFTLLTGEQLYAAGTGQKYYLIQGRALKDVTPLRDTEALTDPFATTLGSTTVTVTDVSHGAAAGDWVTFSGSADVGGVPAAELNAEHAVVEVLTSDTYTIEVSTAATSTVAAGGGAVTAEYQIQIGLNATVIGTGFGAGTFGRVGWGEGIDTLEEPDRLRLWSQDNYGEDLITCIRDGAIYYWDATNGVDTRMVEIGTLAGASNTPVVARQVVVSDDDRHVIAFGCNEAGGSTQDKLLVRWCDREDVADWTPSTTSTAGKLRLQTGSEIVAAKEFGSEIVIFTDVSLHSMKYVGAPYFFGQIKMADGVNIISPGAAAVGGVDLYFMGVSRFHLYNGTVTDVDCDVQDYIYSILNFEEREKIRAGVNKAFGEVIWLLPVNGSEEVNFYVIYNYIDRVWYYGSFGDYGRTAWLDAYFEASPLAAADDGYVYIHETGATDGSAEPAGQLDSWIEAAPLEIGNGNEYMYCSRIIPDVDFSQSTGDAPEVEITISAVDSPGEAARTSTSKRIARTAAFPVQTHTKKKDLAIRGRSVKLKIASAAVGTAWRQGTHRLYAQPDGEQ